jgi:LmbE family N-acetylglucosaminyl deacetylase
MVIAALGVIGLLTLIARAVHVRKSFYSYDVEVDSVYDFSRTRAREISAQVHNGTLPLPPKARPGDSIFAAVRIRATLLGHWFEPRLEIEADGQQLRQAFERGGAGLRYLNLSSLDLSRETTVRLDGKFLHIADPAVTLYYISNDLDLDQQRILVLSPHPDDAEIAAFGLYSNRDSHVVTVTAGEGGGPEYLGSFAAFGGGANAYIEKGKTRAWNSVTVPMLGGVSAQRTANLGYFDETLQAMQRHPTVPVTSPHTGAQSLDAFGQVTSAHFMLPRAARRATWDNLVEDLVYVIEKVDPDIIVAPYPVLDWHPDHKMSTAALLDALRKLNRNRGSLLLYTNHSVSSVCYPYGPAGDVVSLPPGGSGVLFDGLLSTPLNLDQQQRKRVALDAMNDLRPGFPTASPAAALRQLLRTLRIAFSANDQSYFRRAVRRNELFFEVRVSSLYEPGTTAAILGTSAGSLVA